MPTALLILAGVALFVTFMTSLVMLSMTFLLSRDLRDLIALETANAVKVTVLDVRLQSQGRLLESMGLVLANIARALGPLVGPYSRLSMGTGPLPDVGLPPNPPPHAEETFETEDGRHSASSFPELMERILRDPKYKISRPEDINTLKNLFEESTESAPPAPNPPAEEPPLPVEPAPDDLELLDDFEDEDDTPRNNDEHDDGA